MTYLLNKVSGKQILAVKTHPDHNSSGMATIGGYLVALARELWISDNCNGKRPFGDSGWRTDLYAALGSAGLIDCTFDEDGYLATCDDQTGNALITQAFGALGFMVRELS
jgi:hypothetical protein